MKHLTFKFTDGSEIDIHDDQTATISGHTGQIAYKIWREVTSKKELPMALWTLAFVKVAHAVHDEHGIILESIDHITKEGSIIF